MQTKVGDRLMKHVLWMAAIVTGALASGAALAGELRPLQGSTVQLGPVNGAIYYTESDEGYQVVATFSETAESVPVRVSVALLPGQSVTVSVPGPVGTPPAQVQIRRVGDHLFVTPGLPRLARNDRAG
jgi:hypothetical protein